MRIILGLGGILLYLACALVLGGRLARGAAEAGTTGGPRLRLAVAAALALHAVVLYQTVVGAAGYELGFFNAASLIAWVMVAVVLVVSLVRPVQNLALFALPLAALTIALALLGTPAPTHPIGAELGIQVHIVFSVLAYGVLAIAACQSVLLAVQEHQLRHKGGARLARMLPPLQTQETTLFQLLGAGFFLLSLSLVSGIMFVQHMFAQHLAHKTVLSITAWAVFAVLLWGRWRFGWRGRTAIRWSLGGFVILALAYFGSKLVLEVLLGRYWAGT